MPITLRLIEEELTELEIIRNEMGIKTKSGTIRKMISEHMEKEKEIANLKWKVEELQKSVNYLTSKQQNLTDAFKDLEIF